MNKKSATPRFIDLYYDWMQDGIMPQEGLCNSVPWQLKGIFFDLQPFLYEKEQLREEGFCEVLWASGLPEGHKEEWYSFTPLRQTIILLCACINNEY